MNAVRFLALFCALSCLTACSTIRYADFECGKVWGNERYLHQNSRPFSDLHLNVAKRGYMYALAGALVLQRNSAEDKDHYYEAPARLRLVEGLRKSDRSSGFEGNVFELRRAENTGSPYEVIVAFTGSNGANDWLANLFPIDTQYRQARDYLAGIASLPQYKDVRVVVTGFSLGGGLAVNVTKHHDTTKFVDEAWVFNPSPRTYVSGDVDPRIWMAAEKDEILSVARQPVFRIFPGIKSIGVKPEQAATRYGMIKSSPIYRHFRWSLARQLLHVADLALYIESGRTDESTEPLEILKLSKFAAPTTCKPGRLD